MFHKLYMKMVLYFCGIITTTLIAVSLLFFFTVGRPMARNVHSMLRSHTLYVGNLVTEKAGNGQNIAGLSKAIDLFSESYGFRVVLFDQKKEMVLQSRTNDGETISLKPAMLDRIGEKGIFVQSGHFGRPVIYVFKAPVGDNGFYYVYLTKHFPENKSLLFSLAGLGIICFILLAAVYPLSRNITRPLSELSDSLNNMSRGVFDDVPDSCGRTDEIGQVLDVFSHMSRSVSQMIQSKKQLLADISHELCSPLARIRVGTELIKDARCDEKTLRYVNHIENDIESMDHLIMNLSMYSSLNLPGVALTRKEFHPYDLVNHMVSLYTPLAEKKNVVISTTAPLNLPTITGDFERLKRVCSNLLDNALRYTKEGESILIGVYRENENVAFFVEDNGPGVPESLSEKIFEPLFRVDSSRNQDSGGSGLGLAISKKIVELHGGTIVCSRQSEKTRFTFRLPLYQPMETVS